MELYNQEMGLQEDTLKGRYLLFAISDAVYGMEIRHVTEIIGMQPINKLPETPPHIKGVINLRGKIIPVIDMRIRFKKSEADFTDRTCIVVVETRYFSAGLIVDEVAEVLTIDDSDIAPPPQFEVGASARYISGIGKVNDEVKLLIDCASLFTEEEAQEIEGIEERGLEK